MMVRKGMLNRVRKGDLICWVWGEIFWRVGWQEKWALTCKIAMRYDMSSEVEWPWKSGPLGTF